MTDGGLLHRCPASRRERGFTLVELAVVVLVVGLLIGSLLVPLSTQVDQRNAADTQRRLEEAREALIGFAVANGRFPCPASNTSNGQESFCTNASGGCGAVILSPASTPPSHGRCTNFFDGYLPGLALGLNNLDASGYALDAYPLTQTGQGRIRYVIADLTIPGGPSTSHALTASGAMRTANLLGNTPLASSYLSVCSSSSGLLAGANSCGANVLSTNVAIIVYSLGKNGTSVSSPSDENWNLNNAASPGQNKVFVSRNYSDASAAGASFDDQLLWVSSYALISRMVAAGALP
jgi:prepilin-type N-terminal cleavage/methylation domain-containing protein